MFGSGKKKKATDDDPEEAPLLRGKSEPQSYSTTSGPVDRRAALAKLRGSSAPSFVRRRSSRASKAGLFIPPSAALVPLINGNSLPPESLVTKLDPHPPPRSKAMPIQAPYRRRARHRSFQLRWINEFRHWWKSSRLLVRLAGLYYIARLNWTEAVSKKYSLTGLDLGRRKGGKQGLKLAKLLGHGGPMRGFLHDVHPFTRSVRIVVATWRWIEAAPCRRLEVGVEEATAFVGNRCSRMFSRLAVDSFATYCVFPLMFHLLRNDVLWFDRATFDPSWLIVCLGMLRAIAPYAASFQGSRVGRIFTRRTFANGMLRWQPTQRIQELNMNSEDCHEGDEVTEDADLLPMARDIATALGKADHDHKIREALETLGFKQMGVGSGGYGAYEHPFFPRTQGALLLHVTPYGPAICDVLPLYIILEREDSSDIRTYWSQSMANFRFSNVVGPKALEGFAYQGAYFSNHHFAEMRERYDEVMMDYGNACRYMCKRRARGITDEFSSPPTDLASLKRFLETGRRSRDQWKTKRRMKQTRKRVLKIADKLKQMMNERGGKDDAPAGVILYFEGLDCAGKSSTGNLIRDALLESGYETDMRQYNRPPTAEQKLRPWMDRFELPIQPGELQHTSYQASGGDVEASQPGSGGGAAKKPHKALIWDRGPAGDFVYGALAKADDATREDRYREFLEFDKNCYDEENTLFFKLFFVTDRDAIARTLGKRLAHKKICQELHIWLDSSSGGGQTIPREGLDEIDLHIDPTDFIAFNSYHDNLHKFSTFVLNTDVAEDAGGYQNPWVVVSTVKRHPARLALMSAFVDKLDRLFQPGMCRTPPQQSWRTRYLPPDEGKLVGQPKRYFMMVVWILGIVGLYWYYLARTFTSE